MLPIKQSLRLEQTETDCQYTSSLVVWKLRHGCPSWVCACLPRLGRELTRNRWVKSWEKANGTAYASVKLNHGLALDRVWQCPALRMLIRGRSRGDGCGRASVCRSLV